MTSLQNALVTETPDPGELVEYFWNCPITTPWYARLGLNGRATANRLSGSTVADLRVKAGVHWVRQLRGALS